MKTTVTDINKTLKRIYISILVSLLVYVLMVAFKDGGSSGVNVSTKRPSSFYQKDQIVINQPSSFILRENITFILGEDRDVNNPYYTHAMAYYQLDGEDGTEHVISSCRSLLEVRNYLQNHPPVNGKAWGLINLVSHGNQWLGLSARVTPESGRATVETIDQEICEGHFPALPDSFIDKYTTIAIHGCGIGKNQHLVNKIGKAFSRGGNECLVTASELFEYYTSKLYKGKIIQTKKYNARAWTVNYKMGYKPADNSLIKEFLNLYPQENQDWKGALSRGEPRFEGDIYHYTFEVPVKFVFPYKSKDSMPNLSSKQLQLNWIKGNNKIMDQLKIINIGPEKFNWWFRLVYVKNEDGTKLPAIWLKGYTTILCVIKPLINEEEVL